MNSVKEKLHEAIGKASELAEDLQNIGSTAELDVAKINLGQTIHWLKEALSKES